MTSCFVASKLRERRFELACQDWRALILPLTPTTNFPSGIKMDASSSFSLDVETHAIKDNKNIHSSSSSLRLSITQEFLSLFEREKQ